MPSTSPATVAEEAERKYSAPGDRPLPDLTGLPSVDAIDVDRFELSAQYYDTAELSLLRSKITLRRREGGDDAGWHLKLPSGIDTRTELHFPLGDDSAEDVPADLESLLRGIRRGAPLSLAALLVTRRHRHRLRSSDGGLVAEVVVDDVDAVRGADGSEIRWKEIEVEWNSTLGDKAVGRFLTALEERFAAVGITRSESPSKLHRVLGDLIPTRPSIAKGCSRYATISRANCTPWSCRTSRSVATRPTRCTACARPRGVCAAHCRPIPTRSSSITISSTNSVGSEDVSALTRSRGPMGAARGSRGRDPRGLAPGSDESPYRRVLLGTVGGRPPRSRRHPGLGSVRRAAHPPRRGDHRPRARHRSGGGTAEGGTEGTVARGRSAVEEGLAPRRQGRRRRGPGGARRADAPGTQGRQTDAVRHRGDRAAASEAFRTDPRPVRRLPGSAR